MVSYSSIAALSAIESHVDAMGVSVKIKHQKTFSRPQKKKSRGGRGNGGVRRGLQDAETVGYAVITTDEDPSIYTSIPGVMNAEVDDELHIELYDHEDNKYFNGAEMRRNLQELIPWGIDLVNVTQLWDLPPPAEPIGICVVDTGYDLGHVDLPTDGVTGWDPNRGGQVWNVDGNGHGTRE